LALFCDIILLGEVEARCDGISCRGDRTTDVSRRLWAAAPREEEWMYRRCTVALRGYLDFAQLYRQVDGDPRVHGWRGRDVTPIDHCWSRANAPLQSLKVLHIRLRLSHRYSHRCIVALTSQLPDCTLSFQRLDYRIKLIAGSFLVGDKRVDCISVSNMAGDTSSTC
jgi:hypothetical protein